MTTTELRWRNYVLSRGSDFTTLWRMLRESSDRKLLYILGLGFDERMCSGLEAVMSASAQGACDICLLTFDEGAESPSQALMGSRKANEQRLQALVAQYSCGTSLRNIKLISDDGRRVGGRNIARAFSDGDFADYTDVVVDISSLPRGLYFPLLVKLLMLFDKFAEEHSAPVGAEALSKSDAENAAGTVPATSYARTSEAASVGVASTQPTHPKNLHVVVAHSPVLDASTHDEGVDEDATYLFGFSAAEFEREATREQPRVWLPILGRGQRIQLERIHALATPDEICPLVPSPAENAREPDDLMLEYRDFLFDQLRVEPRNILYASESNPFEVYRQIMRSVLHYRRALGPLGGCKAVVSAMSSKLASVGALLAAYELRQLRGKEHIDVGVAHVEAQGYSISRPPTVPPPTLYNLWLAGECHAD